MEKGRDEGRKEGWLWHGETRHGRVAGAGEHEAERLVISSTVVSHHLPAAARPPGVGSAPLLAAEYGYLAQLADTPSQTHQAFATESC